MPVRASVDVFDQPKDFPRTIPLGTTYRFDGRAFADFIVAANPKAKIGVLYQDDDLRRGYLAGLREGLGQARASMIVVAAGYHATDPSIDSQIISLQSSGADTLVEFAIGKFVAQAIRKSYDLGWHPLHLVSVTGGLDDGGGRLRPRAFILI